MDQKCLSAREAQVMDLLCKGLSQKAVAETLQISYGTAGTYIARTYLKLGVHTRAEAVAWWVSGGVGGMKPERVASAVGAK